jgi:type IV pilus assembly protein PilV
MHMLMTRPERLQRGFTLIEILVTIVIIVFGLLGIVGLQAKATTVEMESYQRGQALSLLRDMESRIAASRGIVANGFLSNTVSSTTGNVYLGVGPGAADFADDDGNCDAPAAVVTTADKLQAAQYEACEWAKQLLGSSAQEGATNVGAMIGARGCLIRMEPPENNALADFYIVIVWQGVARGSEPPDASPATRCANGVDFGDGLRRGMSVRVLVPNLTKET